VPVRLAPAKINLALVVGPTRPDGKHEVATVYQRIDLADEVAVEEAPAGSPPGIEVTGFGEDTLVTRALEAVALAAGAAPAWQARIEKRIPVAAGLGGGSSDAAAALVLADALLGGGAVAPAELHRIASSLGADVPFFLAPGPCLGTGDGSDLAPLELPLDYAGPARCSTACSTTSPRLAAPQPAWPPLATPGSPVPPARVGA
jgi:4-diphosphocytidyl-2-C-methyl-D-erythritol kinase